MPKLRCSAESCIHNNSAYCCRGEIQVAGHSAGTSDDTCCANFYEDAGNARNSVSQSPTEEMEVGCEATHCTYNNACRCDAEAIDVSGYGACKCDETCCSTFKQK